MLDRLVRGLRPTLLANHFPPLHGLRVLAILAVLQVHVTWGLQIEGQMEVGPFYDFSSSLWFGMDLFFVLSGFLIGTLLLHDARVASRDGGRARHSMGRFYLRRSFRIFPAYYVVLTVLLVVDGQHPHQWQNVWAEYLYLTNYYPFDALPIMGWAWSLCVEEHFYLAVPVFMVLLRRIPGHRGRISALVILWLGAPLVRAAEYVARDAPWTPPEMFALVYQRTHTRFDTLVAGIALAYFVFHFQDQVRRAVARAPLRWGLRAVVLGCLTFLLLPPPDLWRDYTPWHIVAWGSVTSLMYLALVMLLLYQDGLMSRFLSSRFFLVCATLGYGIYLVHIPVFHHFVKPVSALLPGSVRWAGALALLWLGSAAVAYVLHLLVEKPALWMRDRLAP